MSEPIPGVFQRLGEITRQLHDTLGQVGQPRLEQLAGQLPDARSRLGYVSGKTGDAAEKVLNLVDLAKAEQARINERIRELTDAIGSPAPLDVDSTIDRLPSRIEAALQEIDSASRRTDEHLSAIMLAQDFHDLTSQVMRKVVQLATDLEDQLLKLLLQAAPATSLPLPNAYGGPAIDADRRSDVVTNQKQVDELLASLGF